MDSQTWWGSPRPPRAYSEAIMAMDCKDRRREFFETHVPDHLKELVMDHCKTAQQLGKR